jgi:hypothetical protein
MIPRQDPYGWGVTGIPIARRPAGKRSTGRPGNRSPGDLFNLLRRDLPWVPLIFSAATTALLLAVLLLLARSPEAPSPRRPVILAVRLQETPPPPPPAPARAPSPRPVSPVPLPKTEPMPPTPVRASAPPRPQPAIVPPRAPLLAPAAKVRLPAPSRVTRPPRLPKPPPALPRSDLKLTDTSSPSLPAAASLSAGRWAPSKAATAFPVPERTTLGLSGPRPKLANRPDLPPSARRVDSSETLPPATPMALAASLGTRLPALALRPARQGIGRRRLGPAGPSPIRQDSLVAINGGRSAVLLPAASIRKGISGHRKAAPALPPGGPTVTTFVRQETELGPTGLQTTPGAQERPALPAASPAAADAFDYLDRIAPAELDPSVRVSLERLRTCLDPGEERRLKSRLAAMLSRPTLCRTRGVVFDVRFPESAYSIHIDLYNYEGKTFSDRCAALTLAVKSCEVMK